jgi:hypothetical protein
MQGGPPLTSGAPDREVTDLARDVGVALLFDESIRAFRMSTGALIWNLRPYAPCRSLILGGSHVYVACGEKVLSYATVSGAETELVSQDASEVVVAGELVVAIEGRTGQVSAFENSTNKLIARRKLFQIPAREFDAALVAAPSINGICGYAIYRDEASPHQWACHLGCFDRQLEPLWSKTVSFPLPKSSDDPFYAARKLVRQTGPRHFVLAPGSLETAGQTPEPKRPGLVVRWKDGDTEPFDDHLFATIESPNGHRINTPEILSVFQNGFGTISTYEPSARLADVVSNGTRSFAVILQRSRTSLAGFNVSDQRVIFQIPIPPGEMGWDLEMIGGYPVLRNHFNHRRRVTIHAPESGEVLYQDERDHQ